MSNISAGPHKLPNFLPQEADVWRSSASLTQHFATFIMLCESDHVSAVTSSQLLQIHTCWKGKYIIAIIFEDLPKSHRQAVGSQRIYGEHSVCSGLNIRSVDNIKMLPCNHLIVFVWGHPSSRDMCLYWPYFPEDRSLFSGAADCRAHLPPLYRLVWKHNYCTNKKVVKGAAT